MPPLTDRQARFVETFLDTGPAGGRLVATRAARIAGYAWPDKQGPRLLTMPAVRAAVEAGFATMLAASRARAEAAYIRSLPPVRGAYRRR